MVRVEKAVTKRGPAKPFSFHDDWIRAYKKLGGVKALVNFAKDPQNHKKFMDIGVALSPKNVRVEQEHTLNFVMVPHKLSLPELPEDIIDVSDTVTVEEIDVNSGENKS